MTRIEWQVENARLCDKATEADGVLFQSYDQWQARGRQVRRGERRKAVRVFCGVGPDGEDPITGERRTAPVYRTAYGFTLDQTDLIPGPREYPYGTRRETVRERIRRGKAERETQDRGTSSSPVTVKVVEVRCNPLWSPYFVQEDEADEYLPMIQVRVRNDAGRQFVHFARLTAPQARNLVGKIKAADAQRQFTPVENPHWTEELPEEGTEWYAHLERQTAPAN